MNAMCPFMYLFVVYFSFAPVISASIHRYVNYYDIQVPMMVTETETLTLTLHHNKFTFLDYIFSATFIYIFVCILISYSWERDFHDSRHFPHRPTHLYCLLDINPCSHIAVVSKSLALHFLCRRP